MKYRNMQKALGRKGSINVLESLKDKEISESPKLINDLDNSNLDFVAQKLAQLFHKHYGNSQSDIQIEDIPLPSGDVVFSIDATKVFKADAKFYFGIDENTGKCNYFCRWKKVEKNKALPRDSVYQSLVWKDQQAKSSISTVSVMFNILFKKNYTLMSDKEQTQHGQKLWFYVVGRAFEQGLNVSVVDMKKKERIDYQNGREYNLSLSDFYGRDDYFKRYQILIWK